MAVFKFQHCLCGLSMNSLQHVPVSLLLRRLTLNPTVQMHLTMPEWKRRITSFLENVGLPHHKDTSLIYGQLLVNQNSLNFSLRLFFQPISLQCDRGCSLPDTRFALPCVQLHEVPVSPCLYPAQVAWIIIFWRVLIKCLIWRHKFRIFSIFILFS